MQSSKLPTWISIGNAICFQNFDFYLCEILLNDVAAFMSENVKEVVVIGSGDLLCSPCGGCRQRLREFASLDVKLHMCNMNGHLKTSTLEELLPDSFGPENL